MSTSLSILIFLFIINTQFVFGAECRDTTINEEMVEGEPLFLQWISKKLVDENYPSEQEKDREKQFIIQMVQEFLTNLDADTRLKVVNRVSDDRTPIQKAVMAKNLELVPVLLDHGADMFVIPDKGNSIFHLALNDLSTLQYLLRLVDDNGLRDGILERHGKIIHYAIYEKKNECLEHLLSEHSPFRKFINSCAIGIAPLHIALGEGNTKAIEILISAGANVLLSVQEDGILPIHVAAARGDLNNYLILKNELEIEADKRGQTEFVEHDEYLITPTKNSLMTPKHFAALRGNLNILHSLLSETCQDINSQSATGLTPLIYAVSENFPRCVKTILAYNPDLFICDKHGNNAISYAGHKNRYSCGAEIIGYINSTRKPLAKTHDDEQTLLREKRNWLAISLIDFSQESVNVDVRANPNFEEFIDDLKKIREALFSSSTEVSDKVLSWKKFKSLNLRYDSPEGHSHGPAVLRDYFIKGAKLIFDNKEDIFLSGDEGRTYGFSHRDGELSNETIEIVNLLGAFTALAVLGHPVHLPFAPYIFKAVACENLSISDFIEPGMLGRLKYLDNLSSEDLADMNIPNNIRVQLRRGQNAFAYIDLVGSEDFITSDTLATYKKNLTHLLTFGGNRKKFIEAFKAGFYSIIPRQFLKASSDGKEACVINTNLFSSEELQEFVSEVPIDFKDWQKNAKYESEAAQNSPQVKWFWNFVRDADGDTRKKLLKFCTGSDRLPLGGFEFLKNNKVAFTIDVATDKSHLFPQARACFNKITLPAVEDESIFLKNLLFAIENCDGFQFI